VVDCLKGLGLADLTDVHLVGCYAGEGIPEGKQSMTFSLVFQSMERTLSDEDIAPVPGRVADALQGVFGAALR
jgi:phenylalanyl-tRNA synthetase beta chain